MFNWDVKELKFYKEKRKDRSQDFKFACEQEGVVSQKDKIAFVDSMQDGKVSIVIGYMEKLRKDAENLAKDEDGKVKISALIKWLQDQDVKSGTVISGNVFYYDFLRDASVAKKVDDVVTEMVNKAFHSQLQICYDKEVLYILEDGAERLVQKATNQ